MQYTALGMNSHAFNTAVRNRNSQLTAHQRLGLSSTADFTRRSAQPCRGDSSSSADAPPPADKYIPLCGAPLAAIPGQSPRGEGHSQGQAHHTIMKTGAPCSGHSKVKVLGWTIHEVKTVQSSVETSTGLTFHLLVL